MKDLSKIERIRDEAADLASKHEAEYDALYMKARFEVANDYLVLSKTCANVVHDLTNNLATLSRLAIGVKRVYDADRRRAESLADDIITEVEKVADGSVSFLADLESCVKRGQSDEQIRERFGEELEGHRAITNSKIRQLQSLINER